jgi:TonB family protein
MKTQHTFFLSFMLAILASSNVLAQDKLPSFPGGVQAFEAFLNKNFVFDPAMKSNANLIVQFVVETKGTISDLKLKKGPQEAINEEMLRVLQLMPKWIPGQSGKVKTAMMMRFPVQIAEQKLVLDPTYFDPDLAVVKPEINLVESTINKLAEAPKSNDPVHQQVDEQPSFPGGNAKLATYLKSNLDYPTIAKENGVYGNVVISFIIEKDGSISAVKPVKGIGAGCDEEAIRLVNNMPTWVPGKVKGESVRVSQQITVNFSL